VVVPYSTWLLLGLLVVQLITAEEVRYFIGDLPSNGPLLA